MAEFCTFELYDSTDTVYIARAADSPILIATGQYVLNARLRNNCTDVVPIPNVSVDVLKDGAFFTSVITNSNGVAKLTIDMQDTSTYRMTYEGVNTPNMTLMLNTAGEFCTFELWNSDDTVYIARAADSPISLATGQYVLKARLRDDCVTPVSMPNQTVNFLKDGEFFTSATTDANGYARLTIDMQINCTYRVTYGSENSPIMTLILPECPQLSVNLTVN